METQQIQESAVTSKVYPAHIMSVWPQASRLLHSAIDRTGTHGIEDVRRLIISGYADLWVRWKNNVCEAAIVTEFKHFPRGIWLNVWLAGALKKSQFDYDLWEKHVIDFAQSNKCAGITWTGRKGWKERNKNLPINSEQVIYTVLMRDILKIRSAA